MTPKNTAAQALAAILAEHPLHTLPIAHAPAPTVPLVRLPDWQLRYAALVAARMATPFDYGSNDCALFAADAVQAMTGIDPAPHLRAHTNAREAIKTIKRYGGIANLATACLGPAVPVQTARVGDVVLVAVGKRLALGICNGTTAFGPGARGLAHAAMADALLCWRVG
jgi:hypothetical protein